MQGIGWSGHVAQRLSDFPKSALAAVKRLRSREVGSDTTYSTRKRNQIADPFSLLKEHNKNALDHVEEDHPA